MRKALIAVAVATALFAVGAFAASFAVQSEDTASGTNAVQSCADSATVDFTETFNNAANNWQITAATVNLVGGADCAGADVRLVLQDDDGPETVVYDNTKSDIANATNGVTIGASDTSLVYNTGTLAPGQVWNAAILVDGLQLTTTPA